jgi:hypothetical protein
MCSKYQQLLSTQKKNRSGRHFCELRSGFAYEVSATVGRYAVRNPTRGCTGAEKVHPKNPT